MKTCTMTQLRREFSRILSEVENGTTYMITRYGKPIAYLVNPMIWRSLTASQDEADQAAAEDKAAKNKAGILASGADYEVGGEG